MPFEEENKNKNKNRECSKFTYRVFMGSFKRANRLD